MRMHRRREAIIKLQTWFRMVLARWHLATCLKSAVVIQKSYRCHRCYLSFVLMKQAIVRCQSCVRGWLVRRLVFEELTVRLESIRHHLFNLWKHAFVPLSYRYVDGWQLSETLFMYCPFHVEEYCAHLSFSLQDLGLGLALGSTLNHSEISMFV